MDIFEGTGQEHSNSDNLKGTDNNQPKKNKPIKVINETEKKAIDQAFEEMLEVAQIKQESDIQFVRRAYKMAYEGHASMRRKSGEPYIFHPITVARIATEEIGLDATSVACALLHDVVEDTDISLKDLEGNFNSSVAHIVDGLTKIKGSFEDKGWVEKQAASVRKVLLTLGDDIRVILIKIADRLHNMRTLDSMPQHKRVRIASETLYLYAPIAHRLGLYKIKSELEDLCMKHTQYKLYKEIAKKLEEKKIQREAYIGTFIEPV
ncbi:MAG: HD domain-containing protein, partial [Chitinophagales bacterium]